MMGIGNLAVILADGCSLKLFVEHDYGVIVNFVFSRKRFCVVVHRTRARFFTLISFYLTGRRGHVKKCKLHN